ncbi:MAG: DNA-formamidopyrimidine glycosylase [Acholeplasmataceae bacterium]|jgi:formamidopyrimidine-DNA glycosylase|nr:DNA-formamidopyrimidine glycosylase [Acholeplasmataceae bacterium]
MPELPEVETVRRTLLNVIKHEKIIDTTLIYSKIVHMDPASFQEAIKNQVIRDLKRKGKYLIFILDRHAMIIHLRMEGKFFIKTDEEILKHEHIIFTFESGKQLRYHDVRKFGTIDLVPLHAYETSYPLTQIGDEPKDIHPQTFYQIIKKKHISIKQALLDQKIIAGLGNIYVDETLFLSHIHPTRKTDEISLLEATLIIESAQKVLEKAIELGGTTIRSYTSSLGVHGRFQNELNVHMKKGEPCPICNHTIIKIKVGGRGTYVCPQCQS